MAAGWAQASDDAELATMVGRDASQLTGDAAMVDGANLHPVEEAAQLTSRQLGLSGTELETVAGTLLNAAAGLENNTVKARTTIAALEAEIAAIQSRADADIQANAASANTQLATAFSSQQADAITSNARTVEAGIISGAQAAIEAAIHKAANEIQGYINAYEGILGDGVRSLSAIGITPDEASLLGLDQPGADAPPPPASGTPQDNADWWNSLTPEQQNTIIAGDPGVVGNLDGVPAEVRDTANRLRLDEERAALEAELAQVQAAGGDTAPVQAKLDSLTAVENTLAAPVPPSIDANGDGVIGPDEVDNGRRLLVLDTTGERAIAAVAVGDVDTADNVAVHVHGLMTTVNGSLDEKTGELQELVDTSRGEGGGTVAGIEWIGYQPPAGVVDVQGSDELSNSEPAINGGQALAGLVDGVVAARGPENDPNLTVIGHSYGGVATGYALRETTNIDNAIVYGSIGLGHDDRPLNIQPDRLYDINADSDGPSAVAGWHGPDPAEIDGARELSAEDATAPSGASLRASQGHSDYHGKDTTSHYNQAQVIAGQPDEVIEEEHGYLFTPDNPNPFVEAG